MHAAGVSVDPVGAASICDCSVVAQLRSTVSDCANARPSLRLKRPGCAIKNSPARATAMSFAASERARDTVAESAQSLLQVVVPRVPLRALSVPRVAIQSGRLLAPGRLEQRVQL